MAVGLGLIFGLEYVLIVYAGLDKMYAAVIASNLGLFVGAAAMLRAVHVYEEGS